MSTWSSVSSGWEHVRRKRHPWWQWLLNNPNQSKLGGWGGSRRSRRAKFSQHSLSARREKLPRTCKVLNTMIREKDTDHMIITALVLREWSKVEVPATPTSQTRWCVPHLFEVNFGPPGLLDDPITSPSLPYRTSGSPTDPNSAPPSLNPQTQLNWIRSDQLGYMNEVWPWSFLIIIVVENMFLEDDSSQKSAMPSIFSCYISNIIYIFFSQSELRLETRSDLALQTCRAQLPLPRQEWQKQFLE